MTEKPSNELLRLLNQTVIDLMERHRVDVAALNDEIRALKQDVEMLKQGQAELDQDLDTIFNPPRFGAPVRLKKHRAIRKLREHLAKEREEKNGPPKPGP